VKICLVGKFPPIEGGVSMHTYRYAHGLAKRGHQVHVVTNASEVKPPYRMFMRQQDWRRCEAKYGRGFVRVYWTQAPDGRQFHIPMSSAFATRLAAVGIGAGRNVKFDVVFSYYAEPYAVAGHLIAEALGLRHVIRTAGSDAGRLWDHPQFGALYDHIFRSAAALVVGGKVARRLRDLGVAPERISRDAQSPLPAEELAARGRPLDLRALRSAAARDDNIAPLFWGEWRADLPYVGVYGKLGETKGTCALLRAVARLRGEGHEIGVLFMAHARPRSARDVRAYAGELGLAANVAQIPFLPHWRVPEFIRRCRAICCLEQGFPIAIHRPVVAEEVLLAGACLIASTELLGKLPEPHRMISRYNCLAVRDVNDAEELAGALVAATESPQATAAIGRRGQAAAQSWAEPEAFPSALENILQRAARAPVRRPMSRSASQERRSTPASAAPRTTGLPSDEACFRLGVPRMPEHWRDWAGLVPIHRKATQVTRQGKRWTATASDRRSFVLDDATAKLVARCDGSLAVEQLLGLAPEFGGSRGLVACLEALLVAGLIEIRQPPPTAPKR
jgi:glycosyltransferase involved in cell wall biosynthesis